MLSLTGSEKEALLNLIRRRIEDILMRVRTNNDEQEILELETIEVKLKKES